MTVLLRRRSAGALQAIAHRLAWYARGCIRPNLLTVLWSCNDNSRLLSTKHTATRSLLGQGRCVHDAYHESALR